MRAACRSNQRIFSYIKFVDHLGHSAWKDRYYVDLLLGDRRDVHSWPPLPQAFPKVEEIIISSSDFEGAQRILAADQVSDKIFARIHLGIGDLDNYFLNQDTLTCYLSILIYRFIFIYPK